MQTTSNYIYEHELISPELQKSIVNSKNVFINLNNQVLWIHEDSMDNLIVTNMETNTTIIKIPLLSPIKNNYSKYNVVLYDDNTLWIGRNSIVSYNKIMVQPNYYKQMPKYSDLVFIIDLIHLTYRETCANFDIKTLTPIGKKYFTVKTEEALLVFHWNNLLKIDEGLRPFHTFPSDVEIYPVNWRESSICKIVKGFTDFEFMDEQFNVLFSLNIRDIFNHYKPIESMYGDHNVMRMVSINDNCFIFLEYRELIEEGQCVIEPGFKNIYCMDLTNDEEIHFENGEIQYFISNVIPYRYNGNVKYISNEWYPAGDWVKCYDSMN
jgi:hypothetical protein